jgi:hypothetical protein
MADQDYRKNEVAFCSEVSKWADSFFATRPDLPFGSSDIESYGRGTHKRQDLRFYERSKRGRGKLALCAEVKLPGTAHGRSPFDPALVTDASEKADREACRYFLTWNVEHLALFDRSLYDRGLYERCIREWQLGIELNKPTDVSRPDVITRLQQDFLPRFFTDFAEIYAGRSPELPLALSDLYITVLDSHLSGPMGPVRELRDYLIATCERDKKFETEFRRWLGDQQWNYDRKDPNSWQETLDRAARSMVYVLSNRILFYQAVRLQNHLPPLDIPTRIKSADKALDFLRVRFDEAVEATGDYEPVFFPDGKEEWAARVALSGENSLESWAKVITAVEKFDFQRIPSDVLGGVFQKLISPEERHKFGQHYTDENIVDVINAFCIRQANATVLDPACGSGGFLVRAYYRRAHLGFGLDHHELIEGLFGADINAFPAHLATLNLAARSITNSENYPRIARRNFFTVAPGTPFCTLPKATRNADGDREKESIILPDLDAIVGNPPYVRQELIPHESEPGVRRDQTKEFITEVVDRAWPGIDLSRQSDLHVYFWPAATQYLKEGGWFGFLTSSSWLDVRYGFPLQRWILQNFEIVAVLESVQEPWFEDARVKTAVTIIRRCSDTSKRDKNLVRFVRLKRPLAEILGERADEAQKQEAAERLRDLILRTKSDVSNDQLRIMVKKQADLWREGVAIAELFSRQRAIANEMLESTDEEAEDAENERGESAHEPTAIMPLDYGGGKWGRYLRAPDFYFEVMREFGSRFARLGDVTTIRFGIKSGCDAFFMPRDVSARILEENPSNHEWSSLPLIPFCKRGDVESGKVAIIQAGDNTLHPIERKYVRPELHSLMQVDRPVVTSNQLDRVVLWVHEHYDDIEHTFAGKYIKWGEKQRFSSTKSKSVPLPQRATCKSRSLWYDLTGLRPGLGFWPMAQQYRHIIPANPDGIACNHNLFDIHADDLPDAAGRALIPILNSTLIALIKTFYGRYAGTEGNLKTEIVDTLLLEIPDPRVATVAVASRLERALEKMQQRPVTHLLEESFRHCKSTVQLRELEHSALGLPLELQQQDRRELDDAVFELLGVEDAKRRNSLIDRLYREVGFTRAPFGRSRYKKWSSAGAGAGMWACLSWSWHYLHGKKSSLNGRTLSVRGFKSAPVTPRLSSCPMERCAYQTQATSSKAPPFTSVRNPLVVMFVPVVRRLNFCYISRAKAYAVRYRCQNQKRTVNAFSRTSKTAYRARTPNSTRLLPNMLEQSACASK